MELLALTDGRLLASTRLGAVIRETDGTWVRQDFSSPSLTRSYTQPVAEAADGSLWIGARSVLLRQARPGAPWESQSSGFASDETHFIHDLVWGADGALWASIGNWGRQTGQLHRQSAAGWEAVSDRAVYNAGIPLWLFTDARGELWHVGEGQHLVRRLGDEVVRYGRLPLAPGDGILAMAEDGEGNYWLGTKDAGLICLRPRQVRTLRVADGLPDDNCWALLEASDGALWVGTEGGVARMLPGPNGTFRGELTLGARGIRALAEDSKGRIWIGSGSGLQIWDGGTIESLSFEGEWWRTKVRSIGAARDGSVWVGAAEGLHRVQDPRVTSWFAPEDLPGDDVRVLLEGRHGDLWLGTYGGGLVRFDGARFESFNESDGLASLKVWALHEDDKGALWIGTDRGLHCYRAGEIHRIGIEEGLPDNLVNGIVEDAYGRLWIGHDRGIYRVCRRDLMAWIEGRRTRVHCVPYTEEDGLEGLETNGQKSYPPGIRLRDGRIAYATVRGVALVDPSPARDATNGPPTHIERLDADGITRFARRPGSAAPASWDRGSAPVRVPPGPNRAVEIAFTACSFRSSEPTRFRYRLVGLSSKWVEAVGLQKASYAALPAGRYLFEVQAASVHGPWREPPARLAFRVEPRLGERRAVQAGGVLALVVLVGGVVRWRLGELRRFSRLEAEAARARERERIAHDLHDGLGAQLTELRLLSSGQDQPSLSSEDISRRFHQLAESTQAALHSLRDLIWTTHPKADTLRGAVARVCDQAERTIQAAGVRCRLELPEELPDRAWGPELRREMLLACNEAIHNAIRHARASEIRLGIALEANHLIVRVEDDGRGFTVEPGRGAAVVGSVGLGLAGLQRRMEAIGGRCEIHSQMDRGTAVVLWLPLEHPSAAAENRKARHLPRFQ
jgi:signal transduction histidine kinase/ligand-binding sensor domain-containing protein